MGAPLVSDAAPVLSRQLAAGQLPMQCRLHLRHPAKLHLEASALGRRPHRHPPVLLEQQEEESVPALQACKQTGRQAAVGQASHDDIAAADERG